MHHCLAIYATGTNYAPCAAGRSFTFNDIAMTITDTPSNIALSEAEAAKLARDETVVDSGFWPKVRATLGTVPFTEDVVAAFYCATDRDTPAYVRAIIYGALAYFIVPTDLIPDFFAGLGFTDDATVLTAAFAAVRKHLTPEHRSRARTFLVSDDTPES